MTTTNQHYSIPHSQEFRPQFWSHPVEISECQQKYESHVNEFNHRICCLEEKLREVEAKNIALQECREKLESALQNAEVSKEMWMRIAQKENPGACPTMQSDKYVKSCARSLFPERASFVEGRIVAHDIFAPGQMSSNLMIPKPASVIYSGPKTIIMWPDGSKTMVSPCEGQQVDDYAAFCAAVVKKLFGSTAKAKNFLAGIRKNQVKKSKKTTESQVCESVEDTNREDK